MVDAEKGYALLRNVVVPVEMLPEIAKLGCSVDYDYSDSDYRWRPKADGISEVSLISGQQLIANQIAYRMERDAKK
jgi:hypothetical protein